MMFGAAESCRVSSGKLGARICRHPRHGAMGLPMQSGLEDIGPRLRPGCPNLMRSAGCGKQRVGIEARHRRCAEGFPASPTGTRRPSLPRSYQPRPIETDGGAEATENLNDALEDLRRLGDGSWRIRWPKAAKALEKVQNRGRGVSGCFEEWPQYIE